MIFQKIVKNLINSRNFGKCFQTPNVRCFGVAPSQEVDKWCYDRMEEFGKSTSLVFSVYEEKLRNFNVAMYLTLRVVDTIEDDITKPLELRIEELKTSHKFLEDPKHTFSCEYGVNAKELDFMRNVPKLINFCDRHLTPKGREIIVDTAHKMGLGMIRFLQNPDIPDFAALDDYCVTVANPFYRSVRRNLEAEGCEPVSTPIDLKREMDISLFCQKVNIIRDFSDDTVEAPPRLYWPRELWLGPKIQNQTDLALPQNREVGLHVLNTLLAHTLGHTHGALDWINGLQHRDNQRAKMMSFLARMAIVSKLYNNSNTLTRVLNPGDLELGYICGVCAKGEYSEAIQLLKFYSQEILNRKEDSKLEEPEKLVEKELKKLMATCNKILKKCD